MFLQYWNSDVLGTRNIELWEENGEIANVSELIDRMDEWMEAFIVDPSGWDLDYACEETMIGVQ